MSPEAAWHRDLMAIADVQSGLITARQLAEIGMPRSSVTRRNVGHMWSRILPGVHLIHSGPPTRHQRELATLLYAGPGSMLTGLTTLRHHGVDAARIADEDDNPLHPAPVHALIPHERRRISTGFARIERTQRLPEPVPAAGLALAPLVRAAGDAVRRMARERDVLAILSEIVQRHLATTDDLADELALGGRRGSAHFRAAMAHLGAGVRSAPEGGARTLIELAGLPAVYFNVTVVSESGEYIGNPDAWCDDVALALEVDSQRYHGFGRGLRRTVERNARYARHGVLVFPFMPERIDADPHGVVRDLRAAHAAAAARTRPPVRMLPIGDVSAGQPGWRWGT
jgi:hypothetical protein